MIRDLGSQHICPATAGLPIPPSQASEHSVLAWSPPVISGVRAPGCPFRICQSHVLHDQAAACSLCTRHCVYQREQHGCGPALASIRTFFSLLGWNLSPQFGPICSCYVCRVTGVYWHHLLGDCHGQPGLRSLEALFLLPIKGILWGRNRFTTEGSKT